VYLPAAHVDHGWHAALAASFSVWYVDPVQLVQLVDAVAKAKPASQNLQWSPSKAVNDWYCPVAQSIQSRFIEAEGVEPYFPATQVDHEVQVAGAALLFDWYFPAAQSAHTTSVETNDVPAAQNLQLVSVNPFNCWYFPVGQSVHWRSTVEEGVLAFLPFEQVDQSVHPTEGALLCAWNLPEVHCEQAVEVDANAYPAWQ
jgi:hypothetical protein